ncbi:Protein TPLATE [Coccomyxa sp. Obi]|nr:Protein TPLATE [Coccomyxa sp. Obi]
MASIREDLEADDALRQSTALLQILNYVAGGRDVSTNISFMCQTIIRGPAAPLVKKLAYDVVHAAPLSDSDWSLVIEGLRSDIVGTFSLEVQLSALSTLPRLPAYKLSSALLEGEIGPRLEPCLESSSKEVRAGALVAVGTWLGSADALLALKDSTVLWAHASQWATSAGDALLDTAHAVCAAAFAAVRQLLEAEKAPVGSGAAVLQERLRRTVCNRVLASLPAVLNRARLLAPREQADVASALAAILLFAAGCKYDLEVEGHGSVPGKQVSQSQGPWLLAQVVEYLQPLLSSIEAPVVFEAARAILSLATVSDGALTAAPTLAVGALVDLWDHDSSGAARVQIMEALTQKLGALQGQAQFQLLRQLPPMVAQLPGAAARCAALARIWAAAVAADLDTRRAVRTRQRTLPSTELRQLLSDATLMEVIGGLDSGEKDSVAPEAHYPAFREELVCTLLETLLRHPRAAQLSQSSHALGQATAAAGPGEDSVGKGNAVETRPGTPAAGGAWEELQAAVHDVAAAQRTAELTEWLGCTKIALQAKP